MKLNRAIFASLLAVPVLLLCGSAKATPITGQANIAGNVSVSGTAINFMPVFTNTDGAQETGSFGGLLSGTIMSLTGGPVTGATNVVDFASFTTGVAAPVFFDLTSISPGVGTLAGCSSSALGAACTPAGSPFTLFQLPNNTVIVSLQFGGVGYTGTSASGTSAVTSIFTTQTMGTIPQIISMLQGGGSLTGITYSAQFVASNVPEPSSLLLMGAGLVGAGLIARRKARI